MPTQFTATVKPSNGDYASLNDAVTGLADDITAADIKVFSISAYSTPTIAAGDTVLGQSSLATGICVLVNAARTQILIKTIAIASFLSGEIVQKTGVPTVNVTLSNAGDSPIIGIECYSMQDTTAVSIDNLTWATGVNNYLRIYTLTSERHNGTWDDTKYRIETTWAGIYISTDYVRIEGLQIQIIRDGDNGNAVYVGNQNINNDIRISSCIIKATITNGSYHSGIYVENSNTITKIWNNIIYGWTSPTTGPYNNAIYTQYSNTVYAYNNTVYNNNAGFVSDNITTILKNNLSYNNTEQNYTGTFDEVNSTNNLSGPQLIEAPGANPRNGPDMFVTFVNEAGYDFHLTKNDVGARNYGITDPGAGLFSEDIDGQTRPGQAIWDIGADEYFPIQSHGYITG
jgi:hypothetical protein